MGNEKFLAAGRLIREAKKLLLTTHYNPDADAIASTLGMAEILDGLQKPYTLFCYHEPPRNLSFLPRIEDFRFQAPLSGRPSDDLPFEFSDFDLVLIFDCGALNRTKLEKEILSRDPSQKIIEFDHHPKIDYYADIELRDTTAAATSEVLYCFMKTNNIPFNKNTASCILAGIVTDTGNFLYPSTTDKTIRITSEMLVYGANLPRIVNLTLKNKSMQVMKLWGKIMSELKINKRYGIAVAALTEEEISEFRASDDDLEGLSGFLSNLKNINGILFLREQAGGLVKGSLRATRPGLDISLLARALGGGGHTKASGFVLDGKISKQDGRIKVE
jgi:bifunctional oligoribonuclease and PAP phosphatase NrnA